MKFLAIFVYLLTFSYSHAIEKLDIKNIVINKKPKSYEGVIFRDANKNEIDLVNYKGKLLILNFWATWCLPCKEEMPSLDLLQSNSKLDNLKIFPINIGQDDTEKALMFFEQLKIKNLDLYFDAPETLAKKFGLRGIPTSILFNKEGLEFARIIGSIDFEDQKFINWLIRYN